MVTTDTTINASPINHIPIGRSGRFFSHYVYADLKDYVADQIFLDNDLRHIRFREEFQKTINEEEYVIVFCRIRTKDIDKFKKCMDQLQKKIRVCGYLGYEEVCDQLEKIVEEGRNV